MVKYSLAATFIAGALFSHNVNVNAFSTSHFSVAPIHRSSFVASSNKHAFVLPKSIRHSTASQSSSKLRSTSSTTTTMLVEPCGKDALTALATPAAPTSPQSIVRKTPTPLRKIISKATIPAGALAGFVLTPSNQIIANAVGAGITGVMSTVGKSRLDALTAEAVQPAIAQLLLDAAESSGDDTWNDSVDTLADEIEQLAVDYKVDIESGDLSVILVDIYTKYLVAMCKNPFAKTTELKELSNLRTIFKLSNLDLGEAHANAAKEFYRTTCLFTPEEELQDEEHPDRMSLDKLLWLSARAISSADDDDENKDTDDRAYVFEMSRIAKSLKVSFPEEVQDRINNVAEPFYERALASTRAKLETGAVSPAMLERARSTLGINDFMKRDLHLNCYTEEVRGLLGKDENTEDIDGLSFPVQSLDRLKQLQSVLEIEDGDAEYELANEVTPLFQKTAIAIFDEACESESIDAKSLWGRITSRQSELCLSSTAMKPLLESAVVQKLGTPLDTAMNFARVSNEAGTLESLMEALKVKQAVFAVLEEYPEILESNVEDEEAAASLDEKFFSPTSKTSACGFIPPEDRQKLYALFLSAAIKNSDGGMTEETQAQLSEISGLLAMSDYQVSDAARVVCGPLVEKELKSAAFEVTGDDWTPVLVENLKKRIDSLIDRMKVPDSLVKEYAMNVYRDSLRIVAVKCPNGVPTSDMVEQLSSLRTLLNLSLDDVSAMQLAAFGSTYKKSILESMGTTGVIRTEYRAPLDELVNRLGIDDNDAKKIYLSAVEDKLKPMVQLLANELERSMLTQQQLAQKRGKDMGQDVFKGGAGPTGTLGIGTDGNIMGEIMNLVDFYKENDIIEKTQVGTKTVEKMVDDEKVTEEEPVYEESFPVTALGVSAIEPDMADALYRQFVVGGFTAQGAQQARYESETATFGSILGLSKERMESVGGDIGGMVYENYIKNALKTKESLDQQDMMFLATIQGKLNLNSEQGAEMMQNAQKKVLFEQANEVIANPTPESIKMIREKCNAMGLEMYEDVGLPKDRLESMFAIEVMSGIDRKEISPENPELLSEVQESLGLSTEDCERILGGIVERKTVDAIHNIEKEILRGRDENCANDIKDMLNYAAFVEGEVEGIELNEETANKIVNIYNSLDLSEEDADVVTRNKELLKIAVGLSK